MIRSFNGKTPKIAASAYIDEAACIIGDVEIGEESSVWPGAVIRGDLGAIKIGRMTAVEDNVVIHAGSPNQENQNLIIGDSVHIGHGAMINCTAIGNHVLIGINATLLHDVEIEPYCIIAAGCLVKQGMRVPTRSFVAGVPGRVRKGVTPEQLWWVEQGPQGYRQLMKIYKKEIDT